MKHLLFAVLITLFVPAQIYADVSLLIHEATGYSGEMTGAGHITIFVSDVCTDPPFIVRGCRGDEPKGVVLATYPSFIGKPADEREWYAMPVMPYLYGVDTEKEIPLYANGKIRTFLREANRVKYLSEIIPPSDPNVPSAGRWGGVVGATMNRDVYAFTVKTSPAQDERFLTKYKSSPKGNNFNVAFNNCADFTRNVINYYFPGSTSRDFINDIGMTTPKALARTFNKFATKRPELLYHITKYPQMDGTILRSFGNRSFTETAFTSKKYVITQLLTMPTLLPLFAGTYFLTGYFNTDSAYYKNPSMKMAELKLKKKNLGQNKTAENKNALQEIKKLQQAEQQRIFGDARMWQTYRLTFAQILNKAIKDRLFADKAEVESFFGDLEQQSKPFFDENGELMLKVSDYGQEKILGLTRGNILSKNSDARLAYKLMIAKINYQLKASKKDRETMDVLGANWDLMMKLSYLSADLPPVELPKNARFLTNPRKNSPKAKMTELFRQITH